MSQSSRAFPTSAAVAWQTTIWPFNFIIKFHLSSVEAGGRRIRLYAVLFNLLTLTTTITTATYIHKYIKPFPVLFVLVWITVVVAVAYRKDMFINREIKSFYSANRY